MKSFKAPDIHAPRFRKKVLNLLNSSLEEEFKKEHPEYKNLDDKMFQKIIMSFNGNLWRTVINNRDGVELPEQLGFIFVGTCDKPRKRRNVNFGLSQQLDKKLVHLNLESDSKLAKIFYTNYSTKYVFANRELWKFAAVRQFKRTVAKEYPEKWKMYVHVPPTIKVSAIFRRQDAKEYVAATVEEVLKTYDEFKFD